MKAPRLTQLVGGVCATALMASSFAAAQLSAEKVAATNKILQQVKTTANKFPASHQKMMDGTANIVHLADAWQKYGMRLAEATFVHRPGALPGAMATAALPVVPGGIVAVSNPSTDIAYSSLAGFTQSETSTARCGNSVVVGFNDSGSVFETPYFFTGTGGESYSGSAWSSDGGLTFHDSGPVNPGPNTYNLLGGDPGLNCADANTFYYSQIFDFYDSSLNPWAAIAVNTSTDAGRSWGDPVAAIAKSGLYHVLDKPWSTIDPSNHKRMFVSYTDFDYTQTNDCGTDYPIRTAIEFVESDDGGKTWSVPKVAIEVCGNAGVQGSQMAVSSKGSLYISWVNLGENFPLGPRTIQLSSYANKVLSAPVNVSQVQPGGDSFYLQGEFRDFLDMAMAIDHSGLATDGTLYITWADGRDKTVPDPIATQGYYAYDDVFLAYSTTGGTSWVGPIKVNSDIQSRLGSGHDHYQSGIAVDKRGYVGLCWYDRRSDSENFAVRRHCGESSNGFTYSDADIGMTGFAPAHGNDVFLNTFYMGDYDQMTSDFLNENSGFIGAFENQVNRGNPDAEAYSLK